MKINEANGRIYNVDDIVDNKFYYVVLDENLLTKRMLENKPFTKSELVYFNEAQQTFTNPISGKDYGNVFEDPRTLYLLGPINVSETVSKITPLKRMILDIEPYAMMVEEIMYPYLKKLDIATSVVLNGNPIPLSVCFDTDCFSNRPVVNIPYSRYFVPNKSIAIVTREVINDIEEGKLPIRSVEFIKDYINMLINNNFILSNKSLTICDIMANHLLPEYQFTNEFIGRIEDILCDLGDLVKSFLGEKSWELFYLKSNYSEVIIESDGDYRVNYYMEHIYNEGR